MDEIKEAIGVIVKTIKVDYEYHLRFANGDPDGSIRKRNKVNKTALAALKFSQWVINEYDNSSSSYVLKHKFHSFQKGDL